MDQKDIMQMIVENYPWEQVIYKIIALEALDPWDIDIVSLSNAFTSYVSKLQILDFSIPARYVLISAVLIRLKSDHLHFIDWEQNGEAMDSEIEAAPENGQADGLNLLTIDMPKKRMAKRRIVFEELVSALRNALATDERKQERTITKKVELKMSHDITKRINALYSKIDSMMGTIRKEEIEFSKLLGKWNREEIVGTFLPLIHLDFEKKVECRQDRFFDEIFIRKHVS